MADKYTEDLEQLKSIVDDVHKWALYEGIGTGIFGQRKNMQLLINCIQQQDLTEYMEMLKISYEKTGQLINKIQTNENYEEKINEEELSKMTVFKLRILLKEKGKPIYGTKAQLIRRLIN
ncbi:MAG TPA: SAP domain-containing protein [Nitrosarchaeum sp.]|nr:SAP domain-containing protein [Nitrosarchaeum sp.]